MGIYDRDYYREPQSRYTLRGPRTIVGMLILINVVVFLADGLLTPLDPSATLGKINQFLAVKVESLTKPWLWWQFVTYGFAHASYAKEMPWHIVGNMLVLFFLGRDIEALYGRKEFFRLYLATLVVAGGIWAVVGKIQGAPAELPAVGASGAIAGIVVLYALNFPRRILLLFFVIPMPAWAVGMLVVVLDLLGALGYSGTHIAYTAHLGGAAFAFLYHRLGWNISRWTTGWFSAARLKSRPKLRVHDPDRPGPRDQELSDEVDRILEKIHRQGEASLTRKERRILETASREYQRKREGTDDDSL
jgi:membrane associated rhomboid family serine protease